MSRVVINASNPFMGAYTSGPVKEVETKPEIVKPEPTKAETSSLAIFTRAAVMLAEADTLQKAKELKDMALTAKDWAKRRDMGKEAIQHCQSYALEAERKMGEMLAKTPRAKGSKGQLQGNPVFGGNTVLPPKAEPTLEELGVSKRQSSEAQKLAALPKPEFDAVRDGKKPRSKAIPKAKSKGKQVRCPHCGESFRLGK